MTPESGSDPAEAAAAWAARRARAGDDREEEAFERWRAASPRHRAAYDAIMARQEGVRALADVPEILALRHQTLARLAVRRKVQQRRRTMAGAVAAVALVAAPLLFVRPGLRSTGPATLTAAAGAPAGRLFETAVGQRLTLNLGDGSRVVLNTGSRLRVAYTAAARDIALERGQAWFEVAKDKGRPFRVHAGGRRVEAHGTAFDVRLDTGRTEVMLVEGRVTVDADRPGAEGTRVTLQPHQLLVAAADGVTVSRVDPDRWEGWRRGIVAFDNMPLARAVAEMNRYSEIKLRIADAETGRIAISGGFNTGATDAFVEALAIGFGVRSRRDGTGSVVLSRRR